MKLGLHFKGIAICLALITSQQTWAAGFSHDDLTAAAAGSANAVVASADNISAAIYNPSGLAWQEGVQAMIGNQSRHRNLQGDLPIGSVTGTAGGSTLSMFAISWLPTGGSWGIAGSIATPYSTDTDWHQSFADVLGETKIDLQRYTLDSFLRVNNTLGVSAGLDLYDVSSRVNSSGASFSGSGWSDVGFHAGLRWEFTPLWILGATLRQGMDVSVSDKGSQFDFKLPDELTLGLAHDLLDDEMRLEIDIKHSRWSSLDALTVQSNGVVNQSLATNLKNTTDVSLGMTWFWRQNTQFRLGYAYLDKANKDDGYQPAIADFKGHRLSAGFGGMMSGMHLDVAVTGVVRKDANATGAFAGNYSDNFLSWMFSLSKKF